MKIRFILIFKETLFMLRRSSCALNSLNYCFMPCENKHKILCVEQKLDIVPPSMACLGRNGAWICGETRSLVRYRSIRAMRTPV